MGTANFCTPTDLFYQDLQGAEFLEGGSLTAEVHPSKVRAWPGAGGKKKLGGETGRGVEAGPIPVRGLELGEAVSLRSAFGRTCERRLRADDPKMCRSLQTVSRPEREPKAQPVAATAAAGLGAVPSRRHIAASCHGRKTVAADK